MATITCSETWHILPERRHVTLLEALEQRGDSLGGESAIAKPVYTAERVAIQAARETNHERFQEYDSALYPTRPPYL